MAATLLQDDLIIQDYHNTKCLPVHSPITDGHVIIVPKKIMHDIANMPLDLHTELWSSAKVASQMLAMHYFNKPDISFTFHLSVRDYLSSSSLI